MNRHLEDHELLDQIYGLSDRRQHLQSCCDCAGRWKRLCEQRARIIASEDIPADFLAAQRRRIYTRLGEGPQRPMKWAPALAAACLLAVGLFIYRPAVNQPAHIHPDAADAQLFSDVYTLEQATEPLAAAPIHALFEENR